jgi:hypothetical protein
VSVQKREEQKPIALIQACRVQHILVFRRRVLENANELDYL